MEIILLWKQYYYIWHTGSLEIHYYSDIAAVVPTLGGGGGVAMCKQEIRTSVYTYP